MPLEGHASDSLQNSELCSAFSVYFVCRWLAYTIMNHEQTVLECCTLCQLAIQRARVLFRSHGGQPVYKGMENECTTNAFKTINIENVVRKTLCVKPTNHPQITSGVGFGDGDRQNVLPFFAETKVCFFVESNLSKVVEMEPSNGSCQQGTPVWFGYFVFEEFFLSYVVLFIILLLAVFFRMKMAPVDDAHDVKVFEGEMLSRQTKFGETTGMATRTGVLIRDFYGMDWLN